MRKANFIWLCLAALCGAILFHTSQKVTDGRGQIAALLRETEKEKESIRVLQAEWSYLSQPDRLEKLAREHLDLQPMTGKQFASFDTLGEAPPVAEAEAAPEKTVSEKIAPEKTVPEKTVPAPAVPEPARVATVQTPAPPAVAAAPVKTQKPVVRLLKPPASSPLISSPAAPAVAAAKPAAKAPVKTAQEAAPEKDNARDFGALMNSLGVR